MGVNGKNPRSPPQSPAKALRGRNLTMTESESYLLAAQAIGKCFLCDAPRPDYLGAFTPDAPALWPGPPLLPGKQRTFWYGVCRLCFRRRDLPRSEEHT